MSTLMKRNSKDLLAGVMFMLIGAGFLLVAQDYALGTARRMGPSYFPSVIAGVLVVIGLAIAVRGFLTTDTQRSRIAWRGLAFVLVSVIAFGLLVREAGLIVSVIILVLISAFAARGIAWRMAAALAAGLAVFTFVVFIYALGLPLPAFPKLFGG